MKEKISFKDLDWWIKLPIIYFWGNMIMLGIGLIIGLILGFD